MKVLITGMNGQLGWEMVKQSPIYDLETIPFDKEKLDITNFKQLQSVIKKYKPEIIVNTAAYTSVDLAEKNHKEAHEVNHHAVRNLAKICKEYSILFIHISTDYVFDGKKRAPYLEIDDVNPLNTYGLSKNKGEDEIRAILPQHIILRVSWVFGIHGKNFIKTILKLLNTNEELTVIDDQFGCPTSARSLAKCIYEICIKYSKGTEIEYGTFHFANYPATTWYLFAKEAANLALINKIIKKPINIRPISYKAYNSEAERPINSVLSTKKIENSFQFPNYSWFEELEYTIKEIAK